MACKACGGSGLVAPSPFYEDFVPWPEYLLSDHRLRASKGYPRESSAVLSGTIRPRPCPACNAGGEVEGNPWDVREVPLALPA